VRVREGVPRHYRPLPCMQDEGARLPVREDVPGPQQALFVVPQYHPALRRMRYDLPGPEPRMRLMQGHGAYLCELLGRIHGTLKPMLAMLVAIAAA
jgi:hypothetical protein